ncbi:hypothetical protein FQZ97_793690 [compost metagenome]
MRASKASSTASCKAATGAMGRWPGRVCRRWLQPLRTSAHNTQASRKLGATGLLSPTRRSVSCSASLTNGSSARCTTTSSSG